MDRKQNEPPPQSSGKKQYRSWMRAVVPQAPRSTEHRQKKQRISDNRVFKKDEKIESTPNLSDAFINPSPSTSSVATEGVCEIVEDFMDSITQVNDDFLESENVHESLQEEDVIEHEHNFASMDFPDPEVAADNTGFDDGPKKIPHLDSPLYPNLSTTIFEVILMIMSFAIRHCLTSVAIEDLCKLVNCILGGEIIPKSKHMLNKIFNDKSAKYSLHFYCSQCENYIGEKPLDHNVTSLACSICGKECNVRKNNDGCFFISLPVGEQIKSLLETTDDILDLLHHRMTRTTKKENICDIFDGNVYRELAKEGNFLSDVNNLSVTFNTDGACVFDSAKNTLWPIHFRINELPPKVRFNQTNAMISGIWFGKKEPNMAVFLLPFVKEAKLLYNVGLKWRAPTPTGTLIFSKVVVLNCVVDSKAKPAIQNIKQFNGYFGCGYCYHPGIVLDEGSSNQVKYVVDGDVFLLNDNSSTYSVNVVDRVTKEVSSHQVKDRDDKNMRAEMNSAETLLATGRNFVDKGVKGISPLCKLPGNFDIVNGFCIDYMHAVLLGVTRQVAGLWFDSSSHLKDYYIGKKIEIVNERLLKIKPPTSISRRPRAISERVDWKANEWRSWLLFYSLPVLMDLLPALYHRHHSILVTAIQILLQDTITPTELDEASWYLIEYVVEFQKLYGKSFMHYNVHLLLHLGKCCTMWGPLWSYSAFSFESSNGSLVRLVKGTRGVASQIAYKYSICKFIPSAIKLYRVSEKVLDFCSDLTCYRTVSFSTKCNANVTLLGSAKKVVLSQEELSLLEARGEFSEFSFERMIKDGIMYDARCYSRKGEKSDNSVIKLVDGKSYGVIEKIFKFNKDVTVIMRNINIDVQRKVATHRCKAKVPHIKIASQIVYGNLRLINVSDIYRKVILICYGESTSIAEFPNIYEKD